VLRTWLPPTTSSSSLPHLAPKVVGAHGTPSALESKCAAITQGGAAQLEVIPAGAGTCKQVRCAKRWVPGKAGVGDGALTCGAGAYVHALCQA
jgi:hypothetical protein